MQNPRDLSSLANLPSDIPSQFAASGGDRLLYHISTDDRSLEEATFASGMLRPRERGEA